MNVEPSNDWVGTYHYASQCFAFNGESSVPICALGILEICPNSIRIS